MNIEGWLAALGALAIGVTAWLVAGWWYGRQMKVLRQRITQLDGSCQNMTKMTGQARKQIEQLQQIVAEYRRRHAVAEAARRSGAKVPPMPPMPVPVLTEQEPAPEREVARPPGGWADTQPM